MDQARGRPLQAGLLQKRPDLGTQLVLVHQHLGQAILDRLVALNHRLLGGRRLGLLAGLGLGGAGQASLDPVDVRRLEVSGHQEPSGHSDGPNQDQQTNKSHGYTSTTSSNRSARSRMPALSSFS